MLTHFFNFIVQNTGLLAFSIITVYLMSSPLCHFDYSHFIRDCGELVVLFATSSYQYLLKFE